MDNPEPENNESRNCKIKNASVSGAFKPGLTEDLKLMANLFVRTAMQQAHHRLLFGNTSARFMLEEEDNEEDLPLEKRKKMFTKELRCMMYGFGDDQNPYSESVDMLEDLVVEFITEMSKKAMDVGRPGRIAVEDIIFLIRKDPKKYSRVKELLLMNEELRKARKAFDEVKYVSK